MQVRIIQVGNSKGLRLSKTILEKYQIGDKVELIMKDDHILLKPIPNPRKGWIEQFQKMHDLGDDKLIADDIFNVKTIQ